MTRARYVALLATLAAALAALPVAAGAAEDDEQQVGVGVPRLHPIRELAAEPPPPYPWSKRLKSAADYARGRDGRVAFAVIDQEGRLRGVRSRDRYLSASVVKAMFMVAYLNSPNVRGRALRSGDRALMHPMITRSDNDAATRTRNIVGPQAVVNVARRAGMRDFQLKPAWGGSTITAEDQATFFVRIDRLVVPRHRAYARNLLANVIPAQRWGIPPALPRGWRIFLKGGWRPIAGRRLVSQVALLERGGSRIALAIMTDRDPSHGYGTETIRGVARRLLRGLERY